MKFRIETLAVLALAGAVAGACSDSGPNVTGSSSGQVNVILTDAPFPFSQVKSVDVFVVKIQAKTADTDSAAAALEGDSAGWKTLVTPNKSINLLTLAGGNTANLGVATLPVGTYRSFRLIIDPSQSSVTLNDNSKPDVMWPSAGKNGIKIILDSPFTVTDGTTNLLIDFDVGRSFIMRGNSISQNGLLFKPVIRATTQQSSGILSGSVHGDSATGQAIAGATVEVLKSGTALNDTNPNNVVRSGMTDASGNYTLAFIPPGTYVVRATPPSGSLYKAGLLSGGVTITTGTTVSGKLIILTK
jgi:hypothetical protein